MQFGVIYFKPWGVTQTYVAFSTLEFHSCFFVLGGTHAALNSLTLHKAVSYLLCLVFSVSSWMEPVFLVLLSKYYVGKSLYWCGVALFVLTHWNTCKSVCYRYGRSTVCVFIPLCEVCASNVICIIVSVTVTLSINVLVFQ